MIASRPFPHRPTGASMVGVLLAVALAVRALAIGNPIVHSDEQFYFTIAHGWWRGALPYVDIWDRKPIGLFLLYLPAAALSDPTIGVIAYQLIALAAAVATAWLIAVIAREAGWARGALPAAILYLLWLDLADGQGGQAPVLYNAPMAVAALLIVRARGRAAGVGAMMLVGLALQIKYSVVFEGLWFGLWLLWRDRAARIGGRIAYAAALMLAAALPTLAAFGAYAAIGAGAAWWYANIVSILRRGAAPWREQLGNLATCTAILVVPLALAWAGWRRSPGRGGDQGAARRFVHGWLIAALVGLLAFGTWFDHYTLPVLVPAMVGAAAVLDRGRWRWVLVAVAALAGQASLIAARVGRGTPAQFERLVAAVGRGPGCLYVYSGPSMVYPFTGRCAATRFVYPSHLTRTREGIAIGADPIGELRRLMGTRPEVVVVGRRFRGEAPQSRALIDMLLRQGGYHLAATEPLGRDRLGIYRRR